MASLIVSECRHRYAASYEGPVYLRGLRGDVPVCFNPRAFRFEIGRAVRLREGGDVAIISTGLMVERTLHAAGDLEKQGIHAAIMHASTHKPIDD
jgi:transketolase